VPQSQLRYDADANEKAREGAQMRAQCAYSLTIKTTKISPNIELLFFNLHSALLFISQLVTIIDKELSDLFQPINLLGSH
jgi:hypothetical protein